MYHRLFHIAISRRVSGPSLFFLYQLLIIFYATIENVQYGRPATQGPVAKPQVSVITESPAASSIRVGDLVLVYASDMGFVQWIGREAADPTYYAGVLLVSRYDNITNIW